MSRSVYSRPFARLCMMLSLSDPQVQTTYQRQNKDPETRATVPVETRGPAQAGFWLP